MAFFEYGESPDGGWSSTDPVEWESVVICYVCKKRAPTTIVDNARHSSKLTRMPEGWFCDRGLCDTAALACSLDCATALSRDPYSLKHDPPAQEAGG
jgi:hypothetical protein